MIDSHCHLEQKEYSGVREKIVFKAKKEGLKSIITCCAHPKDLNLTLKLTEKHKFFVFATASIHPEFIKDFSEEDVQTYFNSLIKNKKSLVGVGETGLDYWWIKETKWRKKQKKLFIKHLKLAEKLNKPVVIHSREASEETIQTLETFNVKKVHWHMFSAYNLLKKVVGNGWYISVNTIIYKSKKHVEIVKEAPLEKIMLETDSPWLSLEKGKINDSTSIKLVAEKIAQVKNVDFEEVWHTCGRNTAKFYSLPIHL